MHSLIAVDGLILMRLRVDQRSRERPQIAGGGKSFSFLELNDGAVRVGAED